MSALTTAKDQHEFRIVERACLLYLAIVQPIVVPDLIVDSATGRRFRMPSGRSRVAKAVVVVKCTLLISVLIALVGPATVGSGETTAVNGFGAYPISASLTSMWLVAPDKRPLVMAYFNGPDGWHNTQWKFGSQFEKGKPGWAELRSEKVTLRLSMNVENGEAEVQTGKFKISENNTFLVLHTDEPQTPQKVIPLGVFDLLASKDQPAPVMLIRANPTLMERINKAVVADSH